MQGLGSFLPLILIFFVMYFFMIRPQVKKQKQEKQFLEGIKTGDKVVTKSGLHAKVLNINDSDDSLTLDIGAGKAKFERSAISMEMSQKANKPAGDTKK